MHLGHVLERVRVGAADHGDAAAVSFDGGHELLDHLVVERGHGAVEHFVDVEHLDQFGNVARRDVLHPIVLEQMVHAEDHPL